MTTLTSLTLKPASSCCGSSPITWNNRDTGRSSCTKPPVNNLPVDLLDEILKVPQAEKAPLTPGQNLLFRGLRLTPARRAA